MSWGRRYVAERTTFTYQRFWTTFKVFSAIEALESKSSIVAMNVANTVSTVICVTTVQFALTVLTAKPTGTFRLSGETASAMASAVFSSAYSSVTVAVAFNLLTTKLFANYIVRDSYEFIHLIQRRLSTSSNVVSSTFPTNHFGSQTHNLT